MPKKKIPHTLSLKKKFQDARKSQYLNKMEDPVCHQVDDDHKPATKSLFKNRW